MPYGKSKPKAKSKDFTPCSKDKCEGLQEYGPLPKAHEVK